MRRTRRNLGSTVVEVMMSISVLAVGASGIIAMQKVTTVANRNAKNLEIANQIATMWVERLQADSLLWNHPSAAQPTSDLADTRWIAGNVRAPGAEQWFRPVNGTMNLYGVHDAFGKDDRSGNVNGPFCVNLRLTWLRQDQDLVRAEVRVYWLRDNVQNFSGSLSMTPPAPLCGAASTPVPAVDGAQDVFHFVHVTTALRKNLAL